MDLDSSDLFFEDPMSNKQKELCVAAQGTTAVGDIADGAANFEDGVKVGVNHLNGGVDGGADGVDDGLSHTSSDDGVDDDGLSAGSGDASDGVDDGSSAGSGDGSSDGSCDDGSSAGSGDGSSDGSGDSPSNDDVNSEDEKDQNADEETSTSLDRGASTTRAWDKTSENSRCESLSALSDSSGHSDMVNVFNAEFKQVYDPRVVTAHLRNEDIPAAQAYVASLRNHVSHKLSIKEGQRRKVARPARGHTAPTTRVLSTRVLSSAKKQRESAKPAAPRYTFLSDDEDSNTNESEETSRVQSSRHPPVNTTEVVPDVVQESTMSRVELTVQHEVKIRRLRQLRDIFNASPYFDMEDIENVTAEIRESEAFIENMLEPLTESLRQVLRMQVVVKHREIIIEKAVNNNLLNHREDTVFAKLVSKQVHLLKLVNQSISS